MSQAIIYFVYPGYQGRPVVPGERRMGARVARRCRRQRRSAEAARSFLQFRKPPLTSVQTTPVQTRSASYQIHVHTFPSSGLAGKKICIDTELLVPPRTHVMHIKPTKRAEPMSVLGSSLSNYPVNYNALAASKNSTTAQVPLHSVRACRSDRNAWHTRAIRCHGGGATVSKRRMPRYPKS